MESYFQRHQQNGTYAITADGRHLVAEVEVDHENNNPQTASKVENKGDLLAPMPGVVLNVHIEQDQMVDAGQILVTLESMKMQMEFRAPFKGKVVHIAVKPGEKVEKNAPLVLVEPVE